MSIRGQANKHAGDIARAISAIAGSRNTGLDGMPIGTKKIIGYVCKINEEGDLAGTIDVQEYGCETDYEYNSLQGHHQGVLLSAIQDNKAGYLIVPQLFSDVMIVQNPYDGAEYVIMYSHITKLHLNTHSLEGKDDGEITIGVTETEDFVEQDENGLDKDYNELEPTNNATKTTYTATTITTRVTSSEEDAEDEEAGFNETTEYDHRDIQVGDTKIHVDGENVTLETTGLVNVKVGETEMSHEDGTVTWKVGQTEVTYEDGKISIKTNECKIETQTAEVKGNDIKVDGTNVEVKGSQVKITGGNLTTQGTTTPDMNGPYNSIKACPFSGAPHCGSMVSGT